MVIGSLRKTLSQVDSWNTSEASGSDSATASKAESASTRASSVAVNTATADSKAVSAYVVANSANSSAVVADSKAVSSGAQASSVSNSAASAASVASSRAVSVSTKDLTRNLGNKNIGSVTDSDTGLRISTAGDFAIAGTIYTKAASSAVFTFSGTTLTSSQVCFWLLTLNSGGNGTATQGNIDTTSANCSLPAIPAGGCPVGQVYVAAGASQCVPGTTTFSETVSAGGSVVVTNLLGV